MSQPIDLTLAQLALARGDHEASAPIAARAADASRQHNAPIFLGRALAQEAAAALQLDGRRHEVESLVNEALVIAERTEARLIAEELDGHGLR